jgi:hypothetical protein
MSQLVLAYCAEVFIVRLGELVAAITFGDEE